MSGIFADDAPVSSNMEDRRPWLNGLLSDWHEKVFGPFANAVSDGYMQAQPPRGLDLPDMNTMLGNIEYNRGNEAVDWALEAAERRRQEADRLRRIREHNARLPPDQRIPEGSALAR